MLHEDVKETETQLIHESQEYIDQFRLQTITKEDQLSLLSVPPPDTDAH